MAKVLRCDDCGAIYEPHDGRFYPNDPLEHGDTILALAPKRIRVFQDDMAKTIQEYPIDLCRGCLESYATHIFVDRQAATS